VAATRVAPFAGITRSRFNGSPALPHRTLSLRPAIAGLVGSPISFSLGAIENGVKPCPDRGREHLGLRRHDAAFASRRAGPRLLLNSPWCCN